MYQVVFTLDTVYRRYIIKIDMWLIEYPEIFISYSQPGVSDIDNSFLVKFNSVFLGILKNGKILV